MDKEKLNDSIKSALAEVIDLSESLWECCDTMQDTAIAAEKLSVELRKLASEMEDTDEDSGKD